MADRHCVTLDNGLGTLTYFDAEDVFFLWGWGMMLNNDIDIELVSFSCLAAPSQPPT